MSERLNDVVQTEFQQIINTMKFKHFIGITFLLGQVVLIGYARFVPERFFCWAPFDEHTRIKTSVNIDGEALSRSEMDSRYRYRVNGWEVRDIHNVLNIISDYEKTYGKNDGAVVVVHYSINGHEEQEWVYRNTERQ